tara:strand:- start:2848 stop:3531 length:684 start_codon:yes stop_codon:yes gene_type:complete
MSFYATGRKSLAISDRSGFRVPYKNLRTEWNGLRVSPDDYDPKHPQLTPPKNITDATALYSPRPDKDPENVSFFVNYNWFGFENPPVSADGFTQPSMDSRDYEKPNRLNAKGSIGVVSIETPVEVSVSSVHNQGLAGPVSDIEVSITETGVAGTSAIGTETFESSITETGVAGTGALGAFGETDGANLTLSITETGVAGTGAIGTESLDIDNPTWGTGTFGNGSWGQ